MAQRTFHYKELISFGWGKTKAHFWFLVAILVLAFLISAGLRPVPILNPLVSIAIGIAMTSVLLDIVAGHSPTFKDLLKPFRTYHVFFHYVLAMLIIAAFLAISFAVVALISILFGLVGSVLSVLVVGLFLLYYMVRIQFFKYLLVEHPHMNPVTAFKKSASMTEGHFWFLVGFMVIVILLNIVGALLLGVGLFFSIPLTAIAYTHLYKKLEAHMA